MENKQIEMENQNQNKPTEIIIKHEEKQTNGIGIAGFILAFVGLFFSWVPILGWIIWFLGALFSIIGLFKKPRGFAIAGFIISFIDLTVLIVIAVGLTALFAM